MCYNPMKRCKYFKAGVLKYYRNLFSAYERMCVVPINYIYGPGGWNDNRSGIYPYGNPVYTPGRPNIYRSGRMFPYTPPSRYMPNYPYYMPKGPRFGPNMYPPSPMGPLPPYGPPPPVSSPPPRKRRFNRFI